MDPVIVDRARAVLMALADLSPSGEQREASLTVPTESFRWLPLTASSFFQPEAPAGELPRAAVVTERTFLSAPIDREDGERLAAIDRLRPDARSLRAGWLFVAGRLTLPDGRVRRVFHPLVTVPVRILRMPLIGNSQVTIAGDVEITELVTDPDERDALERLVEWGGGALFGVEGSAIQADLLRRLERLAVFARRAAVSAGFTATDLVPADGGPDALMQRDGLVIVAGVGIYTTHETGGITRAGSLRAAAGGSLDRWTAFHATYVQTPEPPAASPDTRDSPFLLTPRQREAVEHARVRPITVISGAPGTGKSHTVVAIACDALARGERALIAAKSDAAVDALLDLLERAPGPEPVVFGSNERRRELAARLAAGQLEPVPNEGVAAGRRAFDLAAGRRDDTRAAIERRLLTESLRDPANAELAAARSVAPRLFDAESDLALVQQLHEAASAVPTGWWSRRRARLADRRLRTVVGAPAADGGELTRAIEVAAAWRASTTLTGDGLEIGSAWEDLRALDDAVRDAAGRWLALEARSEHRLSRRTLSAIAALATALRSGRAARRDQLARMDDDALTAGMPLWVGTLPDVDDLLPPVPGLFDLVILDEASAIDQPLAATALLRARRAVIVGDPHQLRHVSFVSDELVRDALSAHGLDTDAALAACLDVRRNSMFDVAAGVAPVITLDEHFRSDPHLVEFVADRLYDGRLFIATRRPTTESLDLVDLVRLEGGPSGDGPLTPEVDAVMTLLHGLRLSGVKSVGVVTPFRAQADAIEAAILDSFTTDDLEALDIRAGTVHAFQGNERDVVIASIGLGADAGANRWRFVEDPHLFAVMMTRARRRLTVVVSADPPPGGLLAGYLAQADLPAPRPRSNEPVAEWTSAIAEDLLKAGRRIVTGYPTGRHLVDLAFDDRHADIGLESVVHTDGAAAHVDRHLALRRAGWTLLEAYPSRWSERRGELIVELVGRMEESGSSVDGPQAG